MVLRRGQANAGRGVHGFRHVVDQLAGRGIDLFDAMSGLMQAVIGVLQDLQNGHKSLQIE
jgi:hypothetical protein